jgi:hypothetical protein
MWREAVSSTAVPLELIEFPADDLARGRRFRETVLDISLDERKEGEVCTLQAEYLRLTSAGWRDKLPRSSAESRLLVLNDSSTPRPLGGEEARSLAGRATGSLRDQGSARQAALVPGPAYLWSDARPAANG